MSRQPNTFFLEIWLKNQSRTRGSVPEDPPLSARDIIQSWTDLRDLIQQQCFETRHLQSLKFLVCSQLSVHVSDPQAKLLLSILHSKDLSLPQESFPLILRLLYIWVRKSLRPSPSLIDSTVEAVSYHLATKFNSRSNSELVSEGFLLLGAISFANSASETSKVVCLKLLCQLLEQEHLLPWNNIVANVLAGVGYALCSSVNLHYDRLWEAFQRIWGAENGPSANVPHGLMILHLVEWIISHYIISLSSQKLRLFAELVMSSSESKNSSFVIIMASSGVLRALKKTPSGVEISNIIPRIRSVSEWNLETVAKDLILKTKNFSENSASLTTSVLLQCLSLGMSRGQLVSPSPPLMLALTKAVVNEIFPMQRLYSSFFASVHDSSQFSVDLTVHLESVQFQEAGSMSGVLCSQYQSADEESRLMVEHIIWTFCHDLYEGHRKAALLLHGRDDQMLMHIEKIAESAFLLVAVFALSVAKQKLNLNTPNEIQMEATVSILSSFSMIEYFRRIRLPEYMDAIRMVVSSIQEHSTACVSFAKSLPSYNELTNPSGLTQGTNYIWFEDEVQTARISFYMRVIPTCIEQLPAGEFAKVVAPTMFLYMGHPKGKICRAAHSVFAAFISSGKDSNDKARSLLKEQLSIYYMQRSLEGYPGVTPFKGMASGVAALARNLPGGSPAAFFCTKSLVEKAETLCNEISAKDSDYWKNWRAESNPTQEIIELLLRLIAIVDIQVLPSLLKSVANLVAQLSKDGQNVVLSELHALVAESDDVTRKPTLISWLQSLSYICSKTSFHNQIQDSSSSKPSWWHRIYARL